MGIHLSMMINERLEQSSITAGQCQRNWDHSRSMSTSDVDSLISIAMNMPTKQNVLQYELIAITNRDMIEELFGIAVSVPNDSGYKTFTGNEFYRNGQVNASLLLLWVTSTADDSDNIDSIDPANIDHYSKCIGAGISAGATALAANALGYRTGFCSCFDNKQISRFIAKHTDTGEFLITSLGIGYPLAHLTRNHTLDEEHNIIMHTSSIKAPYKQKIVTYIT